MEDFQKANSVKIADKDIRIYNGEILEALQKYDEVQLSSVDSYFEKMLIITYMWQAVGVRIDPRNMKDGKVRIITEVLEGYRNRNTGRIQNIRINKLSLLKDPNLYRFTEPDREIDINKIKEEML
jgi:hypothetical protein